MKYSAPPSSLLNLRIHPTKSLSNQLIQTGVETLPWDSKQAEGAVQQIAYVTLHHP